jgi:hypothetical protein
MLDLLDHPTQHPNTYHQQVVVEVVPLVEPEAEVAVAAAHCFSFINH